MVADHEPGDVYFVAGGSQGLDPTSVMKIALGDAFTAGYPFTGFFTGDGFLDVAVPVRSQECFAILSGSESGLRLNKRIPLGLSQPTTGVGTDFNDDGFHDLAILSHGPPTLSFFAGGPGGIRELTTELPVASNPDFDITSEDYERDGFPEFLVLHDTANQTDPLPGQDVVTVIGGAGDGLEYVGTVQTGDAPEAALTEDFDADGIPEVVVANWLSDWVSYLRVETGGLSFGRSLPLQKAAREVLSEDFDGDGLRDLMVLSDSNILSLIPGRAFPAATELPLPDGRIEAVTAGDFTGDGRPELALAEETVKLFRVHGESLQPVGGPVDVGGTPSRLTTGEFLGRDDSLDLLVATGSRELAILKGSPGGLSLAERIPIGRRLEGWLPRDFDGNGELDLVVVLAGGRDGDTASFLSGTSKGLAPPSDVAGGERHGTVALTAGDFNGDGFLDLVTVNATSHNVSFYNGGEEGLRWQGEIPVGQHPLAAVTGDVDSDGFSDVVVSNFHSDTITLLRGGPDGLPDEGIHYWPESPLDEEPRALAMADFTGDGFLDVAVGHRQAGTITILRGSPFGLRRPEDVDRWPLNGQASGLVAEDLTGDGFDDLLVTHGSGVSIFEQRYLSPHRSALVENSPEDPTVLEDRRTPPRFRLELPPGVFDVPTPVSVLLTTAFELPQGDASRKGSYLTVITQPVKVLRETTVLERPARLSLLLRNQYPFDEEFGVRGSLLARLRDEPERLRVLRLDADTGTGVILDIAAQDIEQVELGGRPAVEFPITRFGTYLVAFERSR